MSRVAVIAPHPDDEVLGCASVMVEHDTLVVHVTDGVPLDVSGRHAERLAATRRQEAQAAHVRLGANVHAIERLGVRDQEVWKQTDGVARALVDVLARSAVDAVYAPALQAGHPDHDGAYVAAQLARSAINDTTIAWWCFALYALDDQGEPGYGWLHPQLFPAVEERGFSMEQTRRKVDALRAFVSQLRPDSVVRRWLDDPVAERFAVMPPRSAPIPRLRSYYEEHFDFAAVGVHRDTVDAMLHSALTDP